MYMRKVQEKLMPYLDAASGIVLDDAYMSAAKIVSSIQGFTSEDFRAARGNPDAPALYENVQSAQQQLSQLSKWAYRYVVLLEQSRTKPCIGAGQISLMDINSTRLQRIVRTVGRDTCNVRTANGWLNGTVVQKVGKTPEEASTEVMEATLIAAYKLGLHSVQAVVMPELKGKNPDLIVIEHTADLEALGFMEVGERQFKDQGEIYAGSVWQTELSNS